MAEITAQAVNEFRKRTGLGLMECKALLKEADGDLKRAETLAKERGTIKAAGRTGRLTNAGRIEVAFSPDNTAGAIIELNCETDFVARNDAFRQTARELAEQVLASGAANLPQQKYAADPSKTVGEVLTELNSRTGENINLARAEQFTGSGRVEAYVHHDAKSGALVELTGEGADLGALAKDIALQVVAARPMAVSREDAPAALVAEQQRIFETQVANTMGDKPANIREKIAGGKLDAWFRENTLLEQEFVKDPSKKVRDVVAAAGKGVAVKRFVRYVVGETADATSSEATA